jgi:hypothetical protein
MHTNGKKEKIRQEICHSLSPATALCVAAAFVQRDYPALLQLLAKTCSSTLSMAIDT